jgi:hypothetical protein
VLIKEAAYGFLNNFLQFIIQIATTFEFNSV